MEHRSIIKSAFTQHRKIQSALKVDALGIHKGKLPSTVINYSFSRQSPKLKLILTLLTALVPFLAPAVEAHAVQIAHCLTADDNLRSFVEHWHDNGSQSVDDKTITIRNESTQVTSALNAIGFVHDVPFSDLPGCTSCCENRSFAVSPAVNAKL